MFSLTASTRTFLASLSLLTGCGFGYEAAPATSLDPTPVQEVPFVAESTPAPAATPDASLSTFSIDVGVGVTLDEATYAITTNGRDWTLAWRGDAYYRRFRGEILNGTRFTGLVVDGLYAGDTVRQTAPNRIAFDTQTDARNIQSVTVRSGSEPVRFNLWIDGAPATYAVIFSSGHVASTTDDMPFDLITSRFAGARVAPHAEVARAKLTRVPASTQGTLGAGSAERAFIPAPAARPELETK